MAEHSAIEWTDASWNVVTGCDRVSPGCDHCYIERTIPFRVEGRRFDQQGRMGIRLHPDRLDWPAKWRKPRMVFTPSLGDLFHRNVPEGFIEAVVARMNHTRHHTYQVLTKRPKRMARLLPRFSWDINGDVSLGRFTGAELGRPEDRYRDFGRWLPHVWWGTSIESDAYTWRAEWLRQSPAYVRWLSCEPLLGPLPSLDLTGIDWVVIGGESGHGQRVMQLGWVDEIIAACRAAGVAVFVKQLGAAYRQAGDPKGGDPTYWPPELRIREWPKVAVPRG